MFWARCSAAWRLVRPGDRPADWKAAALLLTWLLLQTAALGYGRRVLFLAVAGLAASVIVDLPNWNWWGFWAGYTSVSLADSTLTWLFAGLVIAKVSYRPASPGDR